MRRPLLLLVTFCSVFLVSCRAEGAPVKLAAASSSSKTSLTRAEKRLQQRKQSSSRSSVAAMPARPPEHYSVPILVYHHVRPYEGWGKDTWNYKMSVSPDVFAKQMQWLEYRGYTTITFDTFLKIKEGKILGPQKPVVITFDDNNLNAYQNAFPVLKKHYFTATWYVITSRFDKPSFLSTEQIREMAKAGIDFQSHSVTHPWLTSLSATQQRWELSESRKAIEAITGKPVRHLAYPLTMRNAQVIQSVKDEGYATATIMDPRPATEKDDLFVLPRIMMTDDTNLERVLP